MPSPKRGAALQSERRNYFRVAAYAADIVVVADIWRCRRPAGEGRCSASRAEDQRSYCRLLMNIGLIAGERHCQRRGEPPLHGGAHVAPPRRLAAMPPAQLHGEAHASIYKLSWERERHVEAI